VNKRAAEPSPAARARFKDAEAALAAADYLRAAESLRRALVLAPHFTAARQHYATVLLHHLGDPQAALVQISELLRADPNNTAYLTFRAAAASRMGDDAAALAGYRDVVSRARGDAGAWLRYGHALRTAGQPTEAVEAYRMSLSLRPSGESWWSLADLKTVRFSAADVSAMHRLAQHGGLSVREQAALCFALGKALEDAGDPAAAFLQYDLANTLKRSLHKYNPEEMTAFVDRAASLFTSDFFASRAGSGYDVPDPVFIVGLPRSGSTLVEQILASHSQIEGTMELPDMITIAREALSLGNNAPYPDALAGLSHDDCRALGERYITRTRIYRREGKPHFIDKLPDNFIHIGLIQLILPRAKIIDVRRHPLACGLSVFKQNFAQGQLFSYGQTDIGRYYADYVRLMTHIDAALPRRVHRVLYEDLVTNPERETRLLLAHVGVPFEEHCLRFHDNPRAVRTASSEQVRKPIFRDGLESWKAYEPHLAPLKAALGATLEAYPSPFREPGREDG
jgi:tetratricopeptide (TPR) repeat protein